MWIKFIFFLIDEMLFFRSFLNEFLSSVVMFAIFFPISSIIQDSSLFGYIYHIFAVVIVDYVCNNALSNSSLTVAFFMNGLVDKSTLISHLCAHFVTAVIIFSFFRIFIPTDFFNSMEIPSIDLSNHSVIYLAFVEGILSFCYDFFFLIVNRFILSNYLSSFLTGVNLRSVIIVGGKLTGTPINPMIGLACIVFYPSNCTYNHLVIHVVVPLISGYFAGLSWSLYELLFIDSKNAKRW